MKKFVFFPLWRIEDVEKYLESMEQKGYRLEKIKHSYWFYFKESTSKKASSSILLTGKEMGPTRQRHFNNGFISTGTFRNRRTFSSHTILRLSCCIHFTTNRSFVESSSIC